MKPLICYDIALDYCLDRTGQRPTAIVLVLLVLLVPSFNYNVSPLSGRYSDRSKLRYAGFAYGPDGPGHRAPRLRGDFRFFYEISCLIKKQFFDQLLNFKDFLVIYNIVSSYRIISFVKSVFHQTKLT